MGLGYRGLGVCESRNGDEGGIRAGCFKENGKGKSNGDRLVVPAAPALRPPAGRLRLRRGVWLAGLKRVLKKSSSSKCLLRSIRWRALQTIWPIFLDVRYPLNCIQNGLIFKTRTFSAPSSAPGIESSIAASNFVLQAKSIVTHYLAPEVRICSESHFFSALLSLLPFSLPFLSIIISVCPRSQNSSRLDSKRW